jgi:hypothetical protein
VSMNFIKTIRNVARSRQIGSARMILTTCNSFEGDSRCSEIF